MGEMTLRTKLFLTIGTLFLVIALASFLFPRILAKDDVEKVHALFSNEINAQAKQSQKVWQRIFNARVNQSIIDINSFLIQTFTSQAQKVLSASFDENQRSFWQQMRKLIETNPGIDFFQVSNKEKSVSIVLSNAEFYGVQAHLLTNSFAFMRLFKEGEKEPLGPYIGIRFPLTKSSEEASVKTHLITENIIKEDLEHEGYLLFPFSILQIPENSDMEEIQKAAEQFSSKVTEEKTLLPYDLVQWLDKNQKKENVKKLRSKKGMPPQTIQEARLSNLINEFATSYLLAVQESPFEENAPLGAVSLFTSPNDAPNKLDFEGGALLAKDIFFDTALFDVFAYYNAHIPHLKGSVAATGIALVHSPLLKEFYIANTLPISNVNVQGESPELEENPILLSAGQGFFDQLRETLIIPQSIVAFVSEEGRLIKAINTASTVSNSFFDGFHFEALLDEESGQCIIGDNAYTFFQLQTPLPINAKLFIFSPNYADPLYRMREVANSNMKTLYESISNQLFTSSMVLLGIALLVLGFISKRITKPITQLAKASKKIEEGHYEEAVLPKITSSHDEISLLTHSFSDMIQGLEDREKIRDVLDKVVSKEIAKEILRGKVKLGGEKKIVTILFADIRGFTRSTEGVDPQEVIGELNTYMTMMTNIIEQKGGVIDKYIGDAIMALYGAPVEIPEGAARAIETALLMLDKLKVWNQERKSKNKRPIHIGIGIHTGEVVAGNMGANTRHNYTVLGSVVNLASRLCAAAAPMQIRISKETLEASHLQDHLILETLEPALYKGFSTPIPTYAVKSLKVY